MINDGLIEGQRNTDWLGGTIPFEERNPSGDWTPYLPPGEWQYINGVDVMACVTFSALNSMEIQYKFLTGQERNFSDRFTAMMSGTTPMGNYLWKVGDSIRKDGLVDESLWSAPNPLTWNAYYTPPTIEVINKGKEFLTEWIVNYEFVDFDKATLIHHLKQAPIQVTLPGHAILNFLTTDQVIKYFDSYEPWIKETQSVVSALKLVLTRNTRTMTAEEVKKQYRLSFYRDPDAGELAYWTGRPLLEFLNTAIKDRAIFLNSSL